MTHQIQFEEVVDEIIFGTVEPRNRLLLELMARGGMRISEGLKLAPNTEGIRSSTLCFVLDNKVLGH